jgi:hypothetical protein
MRSAPEWGRGPRSPKTRMGGRFPRPARRLKKRTHMDVSDDAMKRPIGQKLALAKIDAAEAQLKAAVRMYFENRHLVPIYALANAVREVVGRLGEHLDVETVQKEIAKARGLTVAELIGPLSKKAAFFKHADRDPSGKIELEDDDVEMVLFFACHDFGRVAHGMPIEAQVFEAWAYAATIKRVSDAPLRKQKLIRRMIATFPGLRGAPDRVAQKRIGLEIMERSKPRSAAIQKGSKD